MTTPPSQYKGAPEPLVYRILFALTDRKSPRVFTGSRNLESHIIEAMIYD